MTNTGNQPFSRRGGIEREFGRRNRAIVATRLTEGLTAYPENPERSVQALKSRLLYVGEPTVRCDKHGRIAYSTIVPGTTTTRRGKLYERWNRPKSIFGARDGVVSIIEAYEQGGVQYQRRLRAVSQVNAVDIRLQEGRLSVEERSELRDKTIEAMVESGYMSSVYPERVITAEQLIRATELDILNRSNNPRGRVIATSRRPQLITDGLVADDILKKNRRRLSVIEAVCDLIEQDFENIAQFSANLADNRIGTGSFDGELERYLNIVRALLSPDNTVLPKPYSELGAKVRYMLYPTHSRVDAITLSRYMDHLEAVDFVDEYSAGFDELTTSGQKRHRVIAVEKVIREGLEKIRAQRLEEHTEEEDAPMENDEKQEEQAKNLEVAETPRERRSRLRLERQWRWVDNGPKKN